MWKHFFNKIKTTLGSRLRGLTRGSRNRKRSRKRKKLARDYV